MNFIINLILVFDESHSHATIKTDIIYGGIGFNFTRLRLTYDKYDAAEENNARVTVLIYGLRHVQNIIICHK